MQAKIQELEEQIRMLSSMVEDLSTEQQPLRADHTVPDNDAVNLPAQHPQAARQSSAHVSGQARHC